MCICIYKYVAINSPMYICIYAYWDMRAYLPTYILSYMHTHAHAHPHTHTYAAHIQIFWNVRADNECLHECIDFVCMQHMNLIWGGYGQ